MVNRRRIPAGGPSPYPTGVTTNATTNAYYNPYDATWQLLDIADMRATRWMKSANCLSEKPELFFAGDYQTHRKHLRALCRSCPVITECLEWAIDHDEQGFWGGLSRRERNALINARQAQKHVLP